LSEKKAAENWFAGHAVAEVKKDIMPYSHRVGNGVAFVVIILVIFYFAAHQMWSTRFFTSKFGSAKMFLIYAPLLYSLVPTGVRILLVPRPFPPNSNVKSLKQRQQRGYFNLCK